VLHFSFHTSIHNGGTPYDYIKQINRFQSFYREPNRGCYTKCDIPERRYNLVYRETSKTKRINVEGDSLFVDSDCNRSASIFFRAEIRSVGGVPGNCPKSQHAFTSLTHSFAFSSASIRSGSMQDGYFCSLFGFVMSDLSVGCYMVNYEHEALMNLKKYFFFLLSEERQICQGATERELPHGSWQAQPTNNVLEEPLSSATFGQPDS